MSVRSEWMGVGVWITPPTLKKAHWTVFVQRRDYNNGKRWQRMTGPDRVHAEVLAKDILGRLSSVGTGRVFVASVLDYYLAEREHKRSFKLVKGRVENHLRPAFAGLTTRSIDKEHLRRFILTTIGDRKGEERRKRFDGTVKGCLRILRAALNLYWAENEPEERNPASRISHAYSKERERLGIPANTEREIYTEDEFATLLGVAKREDQRVFDWLVVAQGTGLRLGEVLGLEWHTIDWERSRIPGNQTLWAVDKGGNPVPPKSKRKASIQLPTQVLKVLKRRRGAALTSTRWVFVTRNGRPYGTANASHYIREVRREASKFGVPLNKSFHATRHLFASMALKNGADLEWVAGALAHSSSSFTASTYTHLLEGDRDVSWTEIKPKGV